MSILRMNNELSLENGTIVLHYGMIDYIIVFFYFVFIATSLYLILKSFTSHAKKTFILPFIAIPFISYYYVHLPREENTKIAKKYTKEKISALICPQSLFEINLKSTDIDIITLTCMERLRQSKMTWTTLNDAHKAMEKECPDAKNRPFCKDYKDLKKSLVYLEKYGKPD